MICDLEHDILSIYPYNGENIQEIICRLASRIEELERTGKVVDYELINDIKERLEKFESNEISLDMFGAVGDGKTDDSTKIQNALNFCHRNKIGTLYVPRGFYYVTKGIITFDVTLIGLAKPIIPDIPSQWTDPSSLKDYYREFLLTQCGGSIFTSDKPISIFDDGLKAENIGIFGDRRCKGEQHGVGQSNGGENYQIWLKDCVIKNCRKNGINARCGLIEAKIINCVIRQNGQHGIYIGKEKEKYTGETNNIMIIRNDLNRNEHSSLWLDVSGRSFYIRNNSMERCGEYDQPGRCYPDRIEDVKFCCYVNLHGETAWGTGNFVFEQNYSEISQGFLYLRQTGHVCNQVIVRDNFFIPGRQDKPHQAIDIDGNYVSGVNVTGNKIATLEPILKTGARVYGIVTDATKDNKGYLDMNYSYRSNINNGEPLNYFYSCNEEQFGKEVNCNLQVQPGDGNAIIILPPNTLTDSNFGFHIEQDGNQNVAVGKAVRFGGKFIGYLLSVSTAKSAITVSKTPFQLGQMGSDIQGNKGLKFVEIGGLILRGGQGNIFKCVPDEVGGITTIKLN